ncbi:unnamed protein product [Trichogramma brassicae]|uniref:Uncharacterized protein n=1 Tax=Trichogramma brassicae TaxID=86971 RepID=A0A6H5IJV7_9HYME|nr:unnamed protein product [Trichogramma brassicae]
MYYARARMVFHDAKFKKMQPAQGDRQVHGVPGTSRLGVQEDEEEEPRTPPPTADKAVCTSPIFSVGATSKRPAMSPPATRATPKRYAATATSRQQDENNNDAVDQDGFELVNRRRHRQRNQPVITVGFACLRKQPKPRPAQRRVHHWPDAIVIKANDASTYAEILRTLKSEPTLQQSVGNCVQNNRCSAAGTLVLQFRKNVENASTLGAELDKVLGDKATASALQHTTMIEIRDLDDCTTKDEIAEALSTSLSAPHINKEAVKTLRKAYAGTQLRFHPGPQKRWQRGSWPLLPVHVTRLWPSQVDDADVARCTGGQARSPISGAHACEREGSPREHVVGLIKAPPKRAMPPQDVSCALP